MRQPAARVKPRIAKMQSFPAPVGGWIKNVNLALPDARRPDGSRVNGAAVLENWFPTATGIRMRGGSQVHTVVDGSEDITALFTYVDGNNRSLFAATEHEIFDVTAGTTPAYLVDGLGNRLVDDLGNILVIGTTSPDMSGFNGGDWSVVQFSTSGGTFLRAVNGVDTPLVYDGTAWDTSPAITGVTPETLSFVWSYKNRLFFVEKDTQNVWYLSVDTIGGAASKFPLGGVFTRGGALLFGASWSLDSGAGLSEQCVFVSTEGEVAVYQGTNPGDASAWSKVGVYRIGKPRGPKAFIRAGGDLVIATDIGFVPLSVAVQRDIAALAPSAISYSIEEAWNDAVRNRSGEDWHCEVWPTKQMVLVALPTPTSSQAQMFVANARTGAWALFTGWQGTCVALFGDRMFFGSIEGRIIECEVTGIDQELPYTATVVPLFDPLKSPASLKTGLLARSVVRSAASVNVTLSMQADFQVVLPPAPDDSGATSGALWGTAVWGESTWGAAAQKQTFSAWQSIGGEGYSVSVAAQITSGSLSPPDIEYVQTDMTFDLADIVT
ncbi:hypothetical protein [Bradyrhizobium sp.]|jgi:hypothetical protein|uniref:hypothetical protein n=1 Tax=Bradyrhizobium sp. TaxID=376 RepID=UPI002DDDB6DE|nr:hypothetical protein [Bradyrhizobium sp.]HEV2160243.1 hypothetical protein [Bradyrhizobium sp.]